MIKSRWSGSSSSSGSSGYGGTKKVETVMVIAKRNKFALLLL